MTGTGAAADAEQTAVRVDAHHHLWDLSVRDQPWTAGLPALRRSFSMDDLRPQLAANHIDRTVLVQTVCVEDETPEVPGGGGKCARGGRRGRLGRPRRAGHRRPPGCARRRQGKYLVGLRHQVQEEPDPNWLSRRDVRKGPKGGGRRRTCLRLCGPPLSAPGGNRDRGRTGGRPVRARPWRQAGHRKRSARAMGATDQRSSGCPISQWSSRV